MKFRNTLLTLFSFFFVLGLHSPVTKRQRI